MLYKLHSNNGKFSELEVMNFESFAHSEHLEKDLENLIANNLLDVLFEEAGLMPVFQERPMQEEADIYALNETGDLIIFELKRQQASEDAVQQALKYAQAAGQWNYAVLQAMYQDYSEGQTELAQAHKNAFDLDHALTQMEFNTKQRLLIVGSAADNTLISAIDYWRSKGLDINFVPYRVYNIDDTYYFEMFSHPYDHHSNPADVKGVLFDTNGADGDEDLWWMLGNGCVAAFGYAKRFVDHLSPNDIVFYSHTGLGIVAAAKVKGGRKIREDDPETWYRSVDFLTPIPSRGEQVRAMPFREVKEITGHNFFWARTLKVPYLTEQEAKSLVTELDEYLKNVGS